MNIRSISTHTHIKKKHRGTERSNPESQPKPRNTLSKVSKTSHKAFSRKKKDPS